MLFQAAEVEEAFSFPGVMARVSPGPGQHSAGLQEPEHEPTDLTSTDDGHNARTVAVQFPSSVRKACLTS